MVMRKRKLTLTKKQCPSYNGAMNTAILSRDFQLVIPKEIREKTGLEAGTSFEIISYNNRIELIPIKPIKQLKGLFKGIDTNITREDDRI